ncbi:MAG: hypothetical protein V4726_17450 [Verrucomicrobiota bacterium]
MKFFPVRTATLLLALTCASCGLFDPKPKYNAVDPKAVVPQDFLFTRYGPLNAWLDTPVRVQIFDVPLTEVIKEPCLRGLDYRIVNPPLSNPTVFIDKIGLTRRQLLWALGQDYQLHMTPVFGPDGRTAYIEIRSREARNDEKDRITSTVNSTITTSTSTTVDTDSGK